ncbi:MAG: putative rRNA methylase, partial [uncultured Arthrobacter sp.]
GPDPARGPGGPAHLGLPQPHRHPAPPPPRTRQRPVHRRELQGAAACHRCRALAAVLLPCREVAAGPFGPPRPVPGGSGVSRRRVHARGDHRLPPPPGSPGRHEPSGPEDPRRGPRRGPQGRGARGHGRPHQPRGALQVRRGAGHRRGPHQPPVRRPALPPGHPREHGQRLPGALGPPHGLARAAGGPPGGGVHRRGAGPGTGLGARTGRRNGRARAAGAGPRHGGRGPLRRCPRRGRPVPQDPHARRSGFAQCGRGGRRRLLGVPLPL